MSNIEEEARRLYPTSPRQRYMDKQMSKAQQRAYIRGHMHGRTIDRGAIQEFMIHVHDDCLDYWEMTEAVVEALEAEGFFIPNKEENGS